MSDSSLDELDLPLQKKLLINKAKCLSCGDVLESKNSRDWVQCSCGNIYIDGGLSYARAGCRDGWTTFQDLCVHEDKEGK
jgi:hypothetical protein